MPSSTRHCTSFPRRARVARKPNCRIRTNPRGRTCSRKRRMNSTASSVMALVWFLSVLHTWGQTLQPHPHVHCVVPGGGLAPEHRRWIRAPHHFFLPVKVLSKVFRGKFVAGLRRAFRQNKLLFFGACRPLAHEKAFSSFLRTLFRQDWVVYAKKPFGGPEHVLHYLARYTHRVAISNHRLVE